MLFRSNLVPSPTSDKENLQPTTMASETRETINYDPGVAQTQAQPTTQGQHNAGINHTQGMDPTQVRDAANPAIGLIINET